MFFFVIFDVISCIFLYRPEYDKSTHFFFKDSYLRAPEIFFSQFLHYITMT